MPIDDSDHLNFMRETANALGRIEQAQKSNLSYLDAVNGNVKEMRSEFESHKDDGYAHGIGLRTKVLSSIGGVIALGLAILGAVRHFK